MDFPPFEDAAGKASLITLAVALLWKIWLRLKHDRRTDKAEDREYRADDAIHDGYGALLTQLRGEVDRLARSVEYLSIELAKEQALRRTGEQRIASLEAKLRALGIDPTLN